MSTVSVEPAPRDVGDTGQQNRAESASRPNEEHIQGWAATLGPFWSCKNILSVVSSFGILRSASAAPPGPF